MSLDSRRKRLPRPDRPAAAAALVLSLALAVALAPALLAGCGGTSEAPNPATQVRGFLIAPARCVGSQPCNTANLGEMQIVTFESSNQPTDPKVPVVAASTDSSGVYAVELEPGVIGQAQTPLYIQAQLAEPARGQNVAPNIGGLFTLSSGQVLSKDFTPATQVACVAGLILTKGATAGTPQGCPSFAAIPAAALDDTLIANLEETSASIASGVVFPDQQACAACVVIRCTQFGQTVDPACAAREFPPTCRATS